MSIYSNRDSVKRETALHRCSVETLRAIAKDPMRTPAEKGRATRHANIKEGITKEAMSPAQERVLLLGQMKFRATGVKGLMNNMSSTFYRSRDTQNDLTEDETTRIALLIQDAYRAVDGLVATIDRVALAATKRHKEKKNEQL